MFRWIRSSSEDPLQPHQCMSSSHGNVTDRRVQFYGYEMGLAELFNSMKLATLGSPVKLAQYFSPSCAMTQFPTIFVVIRRIYRTLPPATSLPASKQSIVTSYPLSFMYYTLTFTLPVIILRSYAVARCWQPISLPPLQLKISSRDIQ